MSDLNFKYVGDGVDQVCEDLVNHTNWAWGLNRVINLIQDDPECSYREFDSVIIIYKKPSEEGDG